MPSHDVNEFFEIILYHTCECIDRFLREHRIDDRTSCIVYTDIAKGQQRVRHSYSTIHIVGFGKTAQRTKDSTKLR